jgi:hypothetical protein
MKRKKQDFKKISNSEDTNTNLLFEKVIWTEDGLTHLGTVTEIYSVKGRKYLTVMTMFGKRCTVKMSKVKRYSEQIRA